MKHILDPAFRYRPSFATDVRETFARARRERQLDTEQRNGEDAASARREQRGDPAHAGFRIGRHVDR